MANRAWTTVELQRARDMHACGFSIQQIADTLERNYSCVWHWLVRVGAITRTERAYRKWTPDEEQHAAALYRAGMSTAAIGRVLERNPVSVWKALNRIGVQVRSQREVAELKRETTA
jgi:hypothetical protein